MLEHYYYKLKDCVFYSEMGVPFACTNEVVENLFVPVINNCPGTVRLYRLCANGACYSVTSGPSPGPVRRPHENCREARRPDWRLFWGPGPPRPRRPVGPCTRCRTRRGSDRPRRRRKRTASARARITRRVGNSYGSRDLPLDGKINNAPGL